tara:strand:- start:726 stop:941 length:216 start_codon:yes stop_codon:yes gene_type:complete
MIDSSTLVIKNLQDDGRGVCERALFAETCRGSFALASASLQYDLSIVTDMVPSYVPDPRAVARFGSLFKYL